jgi:hypothetical protein
LHLPRLLITPANLNLVLSDTAFEIELTGAIAHMVVLSLDPTNTRKAIFDEKTACSVKVVAGARYQRYLHISEGWLPRVS